VESIGGRAWAEFPDDTGSVFVFALPARRKDDVRATEDSPRSDLQQTEKFPEDSPTAD
jgi:hypothetical protein